MATVWLAQDLRHDRPVALKVLRGELFASLGPERFLQEIRIAARLQHPHILPVHDSGEAAGRLWYTMPYVEGESLRQRLVRELSCRWIGAAHRRPGAGRAGLCPRHGMIHRDIKPENILSNTMEPSRGHKMYCYDFYIRVVYDPVQRTGRMAIDIPHLCSYRYRDGVRKFDGYCPKLVDERTAKANPLTGHVSNHLDPA